MDTANNGATMDPFGIVTPASPTAASEFFFERLSSRAISRRLGRAMSYVGVQADVTVEGYTDNTDSWADYAGVKVVCEDAEFRARAVRWLAKALSRDVAEYRRLSRGQAAIYSADEESGVILFRRYSLGD